MMLPKEVSIERLKAVYSQESDSCEKGSPGQNLYVGSDDAGGGPFLYISTKRWAIEWDEIDQFVAILEDFKARFEYTGEPSITTIVKEEIYEDTLSSGEEDN